MEARNKTIAAEYDESSTPCADWLLQVFNRWFASSDEQPSIRLFDEIIRLQYGYPSQLESLGLEPAQHLTIQTDGSFELVDSLKSAYDGAAGLGQTVFESSLDDILELPAVLFTQLGIDGLSPICQSCDVVTTCGGGYLPHRFDERNGFLNPSVYCTDLATLIRAIRNVLDGHTISESSTGPHVI